MKTRFFFGLSFVFLLIGGNILNAQNLPTEEPWSGASDITYLPNPGYLETVYDPVFNVDITRISDEGVFGNSGSGIQHQYSKVQAWNSDMTLVWLGWNRLLDANDYSLLKTFSNHMSDGRWANTEPNIRYFGDGEYFKKMDVRTGKITVLHEFPGYGECTIGPWEGNLSADDRYVVVTSQNEKNASVYDIKNGKVIGTKYFSSTFDWASMTPWGDYVVVNDRGTGDTRLYNLDFSFVRILSDRRAHADFAIDSYGNRVLIEMCPIGMVRLDNGQSTDLLPATQYTDGTCGESPNDPWVCGHVSGRSFNMPGWTFITAGIDKCNRSTGYYHRTDIFLLKLDGTGTVKLFGHSRTDEVDYEAQAKGSISPDGKKIIFTSNWNLGGSGGGSTVDFVVAYRGTSGTPYTLGGITSLLLLMDSR